MSELSDLYQEVILDHNRNPRNFGRPDDTNLEANGHNPLCGDKITVYLRLNDDDVIEDIGFEGSGCAISTASASIMTATLKGKSRAEAEALFEKFHDLVTSEDHGEVDPERFGKLAVFSGVHDFPARVKCATLAWHTVRGALDASGEVVSTE